ncbi:rhodanese-like domain-containing protein [Magnetococcales bacterium HHB-1]
MKMTQWYSRLFLIALFILVPLWTLHAEQSPVVEEGPDEGMITMASFDHLIRNHSNAFYWYDVRDREEVKADGTFSKAVVVPVEEIEAKADQLPTDKPIIFFCSTGARSGEAYDLVMEKRQDLKLYFLEASATFHNKEIPVLSPAE